MITWRAISFERRGGGFGPLDGLWYSDRPDPLSSDGTLSECLPTNPTLGLGEDLRTATRGHILE